MTNVTISISTSLIFQPRPPMSSLFRSLYDMPGFAPRMDILRATRLSNKLSRIGIRQGTLEIVIEEVLWSIQGSYQTIWSFLLTKLMLNDILWPDHMQLQPPTDQTLYQTRPFTEFWEVSIEHLRRVWHADRGRLLLWTPGPVPLGLAYVLLVETNPFSELVVIFLDYALRISLGAFSNLFG